LTERDVAARFRRRFRSIERVRSVGQLSAASIVRFAYGMSAAQASDMTSTSGKAGFGIAWLLGIPLPILAIVYLISRC
jgi:hypothetical protein